MGGSISGSLSSRSPQIPADKFTVTSCPTADTEDDNETDSTHKQPFWVFLSCLSNLKIIQETVLVHKTSCKYNSPSTVCIDNHFIDRF